MEHRARARACFLYGPSKLRFPLWLTAECKCVLQCGVALRARLWIVVRAGIIVCIDRMRLDRLTPPLISPRNMHILKPILYENVLFILHLVDECPYNASLNRLVSVCYSLSLPPVSCFGADHNGIHRGCEDLSTSYPLCITAGEADFTCAARGRSIVYPMSVGKDVLSRIF